MDNFLNKSGLAYFWEKIQKSINKAVSYKVDKVDGKGLSTNDYTDEAAAKVEKIDALEQAVTDRLPYATEDDIIAMLAETGAPMGVSDADGSVFTDENGNILIM